jgi:hypothetical protein
MPVLRVFLRFKESLFMRIPVHSTIAKPIMRSATMSSSVHRLWIGGTGLVLRPAIDLQNKDVDRQTREYTAVKTAVKVAITVANGVLTRAFAEKAGLELARRGIIATKKNVNPEAFARGVATVISFLATVVTTFTLDIPLINGGLNFALGKLFPGQRK